MKLLRILLLPLLSVLLVTENQALGKYYNSNLRASSIGKCSEKTHARVANLTNQGRGMKGMKNAGNTGVNARRPRLPELPSGRVSEGKLMNAAEQWLGEGYKDMGNGRYVSKDGLRQFRYGKHEIKDLKNHHAHFEVYNKPHGEGGVLIEKAVVDVIE